MGKVVEQLLTGQVTNHMLPFFWQHGEDEATLREYVNAIHDANCMAFCVESRPHPDFCGPKWWQDMDVILDEAKKLGMKVWILDDSHFPTGFANGALKDAPQEVCRQSIFCKFLSYEGDAREVVFRTEKLAKPPKYKLNFIQKMMMSGSTKDARKYDDDQVYSITAYGPKGEEIDLSGSTTWKKPAGTWQVAVCGLSRNLGPHRAYINMMNEVSCHKLIEAVYEPHFAHYGDLFGNTIAGFFSDEPELGNGILYAKHNVLGTEQDLPWSKELEERLQKTLGVDYRKNLPLLWKNDGDPLLTAQVRRTYMDAVSNLVKKDFSEQIGGWCREKGVMYIGHSIEDDDTHACTGSGLGHYFRGLYGQDMAGIDDIGGQVMPKGEEEPTTGMFGPRNGAFYHYTLGKLGVSAAYLQESKQGRTMCEIFGNYGWKTGVTDMKYLADHFLVRGVNNFVPHAFSPKAYPDPDCPPHFYAHGHNPQYRHFGHLCAYMNRVASLISGGKIVQKVAVLYNAEGEWSGQCMRLDQVARPLYDAQIDFSFLPLDHLDQADKFIYVIVPYAKYQPIEIAGLSNVIYVDALPDAYTMGEDAMQKEAENKAKKVDDLAGDAKVLALGDLVAYLEKEDIKDAVIAPENPYIHIMHYQTDCHMYMLINESAQTYRGKVSLPMKKKGYVYDAWDNSIADIDQQMTDIGCQVSFVLEPRKSLIMVFDEEADTPSLEEKTVGKRLSECLYEKKEKQEQPTEIKTWKRSICSALDHPKFADAKDVSLPDHLEEEKPKFCGFVRYETKITSDGGDKILEITDAAEGLEVFVDGQSLGLQIVPEYLYDLSGYLKAGEHEIVIEVATTLWRENASGMRAKMMGESKPTSKSGLCGKVYLWNK